MHQTQWQHLLVGLTVATSFAHGWLSPDIDQKLGLYHRGITHFWVWPLIVFQCGRAFAQGRLHLDSPPLSNMAMTVLYAIAVAWASHVVTDAIFGLVPIRPRLRRRRQHRHARTWRSSRWQYAGLGFETGEKGEKRFVRWVVMPAMVAAGGYLIWGMS